MVVYQGGKSRIGKKIHDVIIEIENDLSEKKLPYFEPFVGVASVIRHFGDDNDNRDLYACDINKDVLLMLKAVKKGWNPPTKITEEEYIKLKNTNRHSAKRGFVGLVGSWGGNFFNGYRLNGGKKQKYTLEGCNSLKKLKPSLKNINFLESISYEFFSPVNMIIYCDPPYISNKLSSSLFQNFDHKKFWNIIREWSKNNIVIISEWKAPKDFKKIWNIKSYVSNNNTVKKYSDNLYIHENYFYKLKNYK